MFSIFLKIDKQERDARDRGYICLTRDQFTRRSIIIAIHAILSHVSEKLDKASGFVLLFELY